MSKLFSASLYFVSFLPLWLSILIKDFLSILKKTDYKTTEIISIVCILIAIIISLIIVYRELHNRGKEGSRQYTLVVAKEEKLITAEYLCSYILPLLAFDFTLWHEVVLFLVFFLMLGCLCVRHNYYSINIALEMAGYRLYRCCLMNSDIITTEKLVLSKQRLNDSIGSDLYVSALNNDYNLHIPEKCK